MQRHRSGCRRRNRQRRWWNHKDPCGGWLPLCFLHSTRWTHRNRFCCVPNVSFLKILLTPGLFCHSPVDRLLLMEKHYERILVHPVTVWHDQQILEGSGAPAHHDTSEPQGGSRVRVCLQLARLQCEETDPVHCVYADQRDVFLSLMSPLLRWKCTEVLLGNYFSEHISDSCVVVAAASHFARLALKGSLCVVNWAEFIFFYLCWKTAGPKVLLVKIVTFLCCQYKLPYESYVLGIWANIWHSSSSWNQSSIDLFYSLAVYFY